MTSLDLPDLPDRAAREEALDITRSFLVQAPAGSGKTELLTMRFLKLLAEVEEPEQVLAITFARPATAEMRHRILKRLEEARQSENGDNEGSVLAVARAALRNSERRGWRLLEQPQRLNIQTIDSLCLRIAHQMPLRAKLGGMLTPTENAQPLYRSAARRTFDRLGGADAELNSALASLLSLRDSNLRDCETLLTDMLASRDQWARAFLLTGEVDWAALRARFEEPFRREVRRVHEAAHGLFSAHPEVTRELLELANYACQSTELQIDILALAGLTTLPHPASLQHWRCIADLLLKKSDDDWLIGANKNHGFPPGKGTNSLESRQKERRKKLMGDLRQIDGLLPILGGLRNLPAPRYSDEQWQTLQYMFTALRQAVHELNGVFAERNAVDFVEIGKAAADVLNGEAGDAPYVDRSQRIRHLLVDEFQDTSRRQHELIAVLLRDWGGYEGRTFFLVGDPMQSIYMFRQADVDLFHHVRDYGLTAGGTRHAVRMLRLTTNFRSNAGVVDPLNAMFERVFPHQASEGSASVEFLPGSAYHPLKHPGAYEVHADFLDKAIGSVDTSRSRETTGILSVIERHLPRIKQAQRNGEEFTVAVLARAKSHLAGIAATLRDAAIPFRAVELEKLGARQEILDLQSLTRALLHPMDRVAWLSLLRSPWCGLTLRDLHLLCGTDESRTARLSVQQEIAEHLPLLNKESRERVNSLSSVMETALRSRPRQSSFASWIERTWHSLGGPACVDATGQENALTYFRMLEQVAPDGIAATGEEMDDQVGRLFARPDPATSDRLGIQLMTIHKAKGLGFNVTIVPGLDRAGKKDSPALIRYLERAIGSSTELLVAPISRKGHESSPTYAWVQRQRDKRETEERKRLLYVACTRAKDELHLFATATVTNSAVGCKKGTLLSTAWPMLEEIFAQRYLERDTPDANGTGDNVLPFRSSPFPGHSVPGVVTSLAAGRSIPSIRRLPAGWRPKPHLPNIAVTATKPSGRSAATSNRSRPEVARFSRVLGTIAHALFERAAQVMARGATEATLRLAIPQLRKQAATLSRNEGLPPQEVESCARNAVEMLEAALADAHGKWILKPHLQAQTEVSWTGILNGVPQTLRIDRSFRAGPDPLSDGEDCLWIIDYKTAHHEGSGVDAFLETERLKYAGQLENYGQMMRLAHGEELKIRLGIYYPRLKHLVWWQS